MEPFEDREKMVLYLGCDGGHVYKYEKDGEDWVQDGKAQIGSRIIDILQVKDG